MEGIIKVEGMERAPPRLPHRKKPGSEENGRWVPSAASGLGKDYPCSFCGRRFKSVQSCRLHVRTQHADGLSFQCTHCTEVVIGRGAFEEHTKTHSGRSAPPPAAPPGTSTNKHQRAKNLPISTSPTLSACTYCDQIFPTQSDCVAHVKNDHRGLATCPFCDQAFPTQSDRKAHIKNDHGDILGKEALGKQGAY
jgi:uncharacterized Zn-finger protein